MHLHRRVLVPLVVLVVCGCADDVEKKMDAVNNANNASNNSTSSSSNNTSSGSNNSTSSGSNNGTSSDSNNSTSSSSNNGAVEGAITVFPESLSVTEDGPDGTFTVELDVPPQAEVVVDLVSLDPMQATVAPASLRWGVGETLPKTVTVSPVFDVLVDGTQTVVIQTTVTGTGNYADVEAADVLVDVIDITDVSGIVQPTTLQVTEGGPADSFEVALSVQPTGTVVIPISSSDPTQLTTSVSSLEFDPTNFSALQSVEVAAVDDSQLEGTASLSIIVGVATGGMYDGLDLPDVDVTVLDNETAMAVVVPTAVVTDESGTTATFDVLLSSVAPEIVTITATSGGPSEGIVSGPVDIAVGETTASFTVTGLSDGIADGNQTYSITLTASSVSPLWDGITIPSVSVVNIDI